MFRALVLIAAFGLAAAAHADSVADEADFRFRRGATLYREGRIDDALGEFLESNRLVHNRNVAFNIARCFEKLLRFNEAYRWYVEMLADPDLPGEDRKSVQAALGRLGGSLALVRIESDPPGATVYIDRKDLGGRGQTPVTMALPRGNAKVLVEHDGYRPAQTDTTAETGMTAEVHLRLERILGTLELSGEPQAFEARLDSADAAPLLTAPGSVKVVPGAHRLFVSAPGTVPQVLDAQVPPDGVERVAFKLLPLPPPSGTLIVRANLDGALVRVDGHEAGFTPAVIDKVRVGPHKLEVLAEGREPLSMDVQVAADERTPVEVKLRYALPRVQAAERQLTRAQDAPASITIISSQEIRGFGYATLAEALRAVRGLFVSDDRDYQSLGVRGFSPPGTYNNRVLVLADGHITNDISLGQGFIGRDFDTDLNDVERIEIVRGPGSVLYGSAAYLAVVNVVHRTPALGLHASGGATFLSEIGAGAVVSEALEGRWLSLHAGVFRSDGEPLFHSPSLPGFASNVDGEDAAHADLRGHFRELSLYLSVNDRTKQLPTAPFGTVFGLPGTSTHDTRYFGEIAWAHPLAVGGGLDARVSVDGRKHDAELLYQGVVPG
ncbi:MAG: TonB-dependent receptor, partial [Myxococcales bacterium]